jgi:ATP-dependent DNA ligase
VYYAFDILVHEHRDLTRLPLSERRQYFPPSLNPTSTLRSPSCPIAPQRKCWNLQQRMAWRG